MATVRTRTLIASLALSATAFVGVAVHEGYVDTATVPTKNDRPTSGFGSTFHEDGTPIRLGEKTDPVTALKRSLVHIQKSEIGLKKCVTGPLNQIEYDILVDFSYQYGVVATCKSSMVRQINAGKYDDACKAYTLYKLSGGYDCSLTANKKICGGVWTRNTERRDKCLGVQ